MPYICPPREGNGCAGVYHDPSLQLFFIRSQLDDLAGPLFFRLANPDEQSSARLERMTRVVGKPFEHRVTAGSAIERKFRFEFANSDRQLRNVLGSDVRRIAGDHEGAARVAKHRDRAVQTRGVERNGALLLLREVHIFAVQLQR